MSDIAVRLEHVYKKFAKGERHDSLRDLIPALAKRAVKRMAGPLELKETEFWALNDVSFEIKKGEAVGILGHNGAGKSTMLKHLSGIMRPTRGTIEINGRLSALIEVGAGFHQDLTGRENIYLNGVILGMSREEIRRKFDEIVSFSGLEEFIDTPVKRYSSGMYARLGFSVAVHLEPDILIIDEVLSVGDYVFQAKGVEKMRAAMTSGATVIFVSHNLRAITDLCPRSILLERGRLLDDGPTPNIVRAYMERIKGVRTQNRDSDVLIENVVVHDGKNPKSNFVSGDTAHVDVEFRCNRSTEKIAVVLHLQDEKYYEVFNTSTERLGIPAFSMQAGERMRCTFTLDLHLASGSFHFAVLLYRYDSSKTYDAFDPAATIIVRSPMDVRGAVNMYPRAKLHARECQTAIAAESGA